MTCYQAVYDAVNVNTSGMSYIPDAIRSEISFLSAQMSRPHVLMRPKIYPDGNKWCALYGDDLMSGVSGFGSTPQEAAQDFDANWLNQEPARTV